MMRISDASSRNGGKAVQMRNRHGITGRKNCVLFLAGSATANDTSRFMACLATLSDFGMGYCIDKYDSN